MGSAFNRAGAGDATRRTLARTFAAALDAMCENCGTARHTTTRGIRQVCAACAAAYDDATPTNHEEER